MASVAQISDIKGLVTQEGDLEEILKNRDPISDHGGLLTISGFAKVLFEDKAPEDIDGPVQFSTDFSFFDDEFDRDEVAVDVASFDMFANEFGDGEEELLNSNLEDPNALAGEVDTEQLDTGLGEFEPEIDDRGGVPDDEEESPATPLEDDTEETPETIAETTAPEDGEVQATGESTDPTEPIATADEPETTTTPEDRETPTDSGSQSEPTPLIGAIILEDISLPEGSKEATISASVDTPPATDLTITLSNGATIIIKAGESTGVSTPFAIQEDDLVIDPEEYELSIKETSGGGYDSLDSSDTALVEVTDTIDTVYVKVVGSDSVDESSGESLEHKVVLVDKDGEPVTVPEGESLTVGLVYTDGDNLDSDDFASSRVLEVTIEGGQSEVAISNEVSDDFFDEGSESYTLGIATVSGENSFESVEISPEEVTGSIVDSDSLEALSDTATATETGDEYVASEDESDDGQSASGNVIDSDSSSNGLEMSLVEVKVDDTVYTLPEDGSDISIKGNYGTLSINSSGAYTYSVDESLTDSWNVGDEGAESFSYTITDGYNQASANLDITVEGRDDAPEITSITGNDRAAHTIDGIMDVDGDGQIDTVDVHNDATTKNDKGLVDTDKGIRFHSESGDFNLNMGDQNSSLEVMYHGGQAGYSNILGIYTADENGNPIEGKIIHIDETRGMDNYEATSLGTINGLSGNVGFFIIPDGADKISGVTKDTPISFDNSTGKVVVGNSSYETFYTDNHLNRDGHDHAMVAKDNDIDGLVIGFEDLKLGDKDYDDVVFSIKPCETLGQPITTTLLTEDFEGVDKGDGDTNKNSDWYVDHGTDGDNVLVSNSGVEWTMNDAGIEMRVDDGVHGLDTADGSGNYVELDAHTRGTNSSITTTVDLGLANDVYNLTFDYTPRPGKADSSDMKFSLAGKEIEINVDSKGNITTNSLDTDATVTITPIDGTKWYKVDAQFANIDTQSAELNFQSTGVADTFGAYIDQIKLEGTDYSNTNKILSNIELSDVDDTYLEGAKIELTNFKAGDTLDGGTNSYGIAVTIADGVVELSGSATIEQYEEVLESFTFETTSEDREVRNFEYTVFDGDKHSNTMEVRVDIGGCEINTVAPPVADAVLTTSNLDTDDAVLEDFAKAIGIDESTALEDQIAFFKKLDIGGGLDGDITNAENDSSDPADLGGEDLETTEGNLVFDITSLPDYGTIYKEDGTVVTDATTLSTNDTIYWVATHKEVPSDSTEKSIGGFNENGTLKSWDSSDVTVIARDGNNQDATITTVHKDGVGVQGANNSGIANQLGYDPVAQKSESLIFDFAKPVTDADVAITHLIKGEKGGEVGKFEAFLDGKSLGEFTFTSSTHQNANADYQLVAESHGKGNAEGTHSGTLVIDNLVFDQLRFSADPYVNQANHVNDSSDYYIGGITYHEVNGVEFEYKVIDESGLESDAVPVKIDVATDTPVPPANTPPTTTDDTITAYEDTPYTLAMDDFGTYSDETVAKTVSIESLPTNGVLKLDGSSVSNGDEIDVSDIEAGKLVFIPTNNTDDGSSFTFKVSDGDLWSGVHTTTIDISAIADIPTASISVSNGSLVGDNLVVNGSFEDLSGKSIADKGLHGYTNNSNNALNGWTLIEGDQMQVHDKDHLMSGRSGSKALGAADGEYYMDMESSPHNIGISQTVNGLTAGTTYSLSFSIADKAMADPNDHINGSPLDFQGKDSTIMKVYWNNELVDTINTDTTDWTEFSYDVVAGTGDGSNTLKFIETGVSGDYHGTALDNIVLSPKMVGYDVDISAALADTDGSESLTVQLIGVPANAQLSSDNYTITQDSNDSSVWNVTVDPNVTSLNDNSISMIVPSGTDISGIKISATATEANDNSSANTLADETDEVSTQIFDGDFDKDRVSYDEDSGTISVDTAKISDDVDKFEFDDSSFNVIKGTSGNDNIKGTSEADMIFGGAGDDTIEGTSEDDVVYGGSGEDALLVEGELELDFTKVSSVETIDMSDNDSDDTLTMVNIDDMLDTNDDAIEIKGDDEDSITKGADEPETEVTQKEDGTKEISVPDGSLKAIVDESIDTSGFDDDTNAVS